MSQRNTTIRLKCPPPLFGPLALRHIHQLRIVVYSEIIGTPDFAFVDRYAQRTRQDRLIGRGDVMLFCTWDIMRPFCHEIAVPHNRDAISVICEF